MFSSSPLLASNEFLSVKHAVFFVLCFLSALPQAIPTLQILQSLVCSVSFRS